MKTPEPGTVRILVVDDEKLIRWSLEECLSRAGYKVRSAENGYNAEQLVRDEDFDLALLDYKLPDTDGLTLLSKLQKISADLPVIVITAHSSLDNAVASMRAGANDYIAKPFQEEDVVLRVGKVLENAHLRRVVDKQREENTRLFSFENIVGESQEMKRVLELVKRVCEIGDATVLIHGESGTGKDVIAKAIHYNSPRGDGPYINITCTAIPESLLESILFGHEKGAFTDAKAQKKGLLEEANGGTVFLDEIGDMTLYLQGKILRFLEERTIQRVGGVSEIKVDVRVIAATNKDLKQLVSSEKFREDLYFRLKVIPIEVPALRQRKEDIPILIDHFIDVYNREFKKTVRGISPDLLEQFKEYHWPGNVRELKNTIERAMILGKGELLESESVPLALIDDNGRASGSGHPFELTKEGINLSEIERDLVCQALKLSRGNQTKAGQYLGLNRDQIRYRVEKFGLDVASFAAD